MNQNIRFQNRNFLQITWW